MITTYFKAYNLIFIVRPNVTVLAITEHRKKLFLNHTQAWKKDRKRFYFFILNVNKITFTCSLSTSILDTEVNAFARWQVKTHSLLTWSYRNWITPTYECNWYIIRSFTGMQNVNIWCKNTCFSNCKCFWFVIVETYGFIPRTSPDFELWFKTTHHIWWSDYFVCDYTTDQRPSSIFHGTLPSWYNAHYNYDEICQWSTKQPVHMANQFELLVCFNCDKICYITTMTRYSIGLLGLNILCMFFNQFELFFSEQGYTPVCWRHTDGTDSWKRG